MTGDSRHFKSYQDLRVWQQSMSLAKEIYQLTGSFPASERFGLTAQMRRAAVSIPSNIAEGHSRSGSKDFYRFLSIALGSVAELETQIIVSADLNFLNLEIHREILFRLNSIGKMIRGLQKSIESYCVRDISVAPYATDGDGFETSSESAEPSLEPLVSSLEDQTEFTT